MRKIIIVVILVALIGATLTTVMAQEQTVVTQDNIRSLLNNIDSSIIAFRKGGTSASKASLQSINIQNQILTISTRFENVDNAFQTTLLNDYGSAASSGTEDSIRTLRADVLLAASKIGVSVSPVYSQAIFVILAIAIVFSLVITLITKRVVDWPKVKAARKEMDDWRKQMMDAQRKKDMKRLYKLQQDQKRIMGLQGQVMMSSFKPAIFYIVPYFILWIYLSGLYKSWVVGWLPFNLPLPYFGTMVSLGFLSWFLISYFGFSQIWRKLLIGD